MEEQILKQLAQPLLAWYDIHRRILPWREEVSPYRTWVSEIMLQQTRVAAVLVLLVLSTAYVVGSTNSPFLYFNF